MITALLEKYNIPQEWETRVRQSGMPYHNTMRRLFSGESLESALQVPTVEEDKFDVAEGVTQCGKCKSFRVLEMSIQTRSADEGEIGRAHV